MGIASLCYRVALFGASVHALAFPGPQPTDIANNNNAFRPDGWSPKPTAAPEFREVVRRQKDFATTLLMAPDNTCGFLNGHSSTLCPVSPPPPPQGAASLVYENVCLVVLTRAPKRRLMPASNRT